MCFLKSITFSRLGMLVPALLLQSLFTAITRHPCSTWQVFCDMLYQWYYCLACNCIILMFISLVLLLFVIITFNRLQMSTPLHPLTQQLSPPSLCSSLLFHRPSLSCHYSSYKSLWATCHDSSSTTSNSWVGLL